MDLATRFADNPIIRPTDVLPSVRGAEVVGVLNPGACCFAGKTLLSMRVAERMKQREGQVSTLVYDETQPNGVRVVEYALDDPKLQCGDPRGFSYDGRPYLTTLSHLRLAESSDGIHFRIHPAPLIRGSGPLETFGMEDCRVSRLGDRFCLTYSAVSPVGVGVGLQITTDWRTFTPMGLILPPPNKDCVIFEEQFAGRYLCLHRPMVETWQALDIWCASSPDLRHWGDHRCIARTRHGWWDSQRIGAGAAPIRTPKGWLEIYHGCDAKSRYCLGALLLDLDDPTRVLARSADPIMEPSADYERAGFFGSVVFTNGHVVDGDTITLYYGASDSVICGATLSLDGILRTLSA